MYIASVIIMSTLSLPWYIIVSTDEALATESWRNKNTTINRVNAMKSLPQANGSRPSTELLVISLVTWLKEIQVHNLLSKILKTEKL
jgi:hypothetical protein